MDPACPWGSLLFGITAPPPGSTATLTSPVRRGLARGPQQQGEGVRGGHSSQGPAPLLTPLPFRPSRFPALLFNSHLSLPQSPDPIWLQSGCPTGRPYSRHTQLLPTQHTHTSAAAAGVGPEAPTRRHWVAWELLSSGGTPGWPQPPARRRRPNSEPSGPAAPRLVPCRVAAEPAPPTPPLPGSLRPTASPGTATAETAPAWTPRAITWAYPFARLLGPTFRGRGSALDPVAPPPTELDPFSWTVAAPLTG